MYHKLICCLLGGFLLTACYFDNEEDLFQYVNDAETGDCMVTSAAYSADIVPLLTAYCTRCHRDGREDGGVNLEGYDRVDRYVADGSLLGSTRHESGYAAMPPSGGLIPACDIEKLAAWIAAGAPNN